MAAVYFMMVLFFKNLHVIPGFEKEFALQCYNDFEKEFVCPFPLIQRNCSEYRITLPDFGNKSCNYKHENGFSKCQCKIEMSLIFGHEHTVYFWENDKLLNSTVVHISDTIKPKAPKNVVVQRTVHGHFLVKWKTNYEDTPFSERLTARVIYWKNGGNRKEVPNIASRHYEIRGDDLEPNTNYSVIVQNFASFSQQYSDNSTECFFTSAGSMESLLKVGIIVISIGVVILIVVLFCCYIRLKSSFWDKVPKPTVPKMSSVEKLVLLPSETFISPVYAHTLAIDANDVKLGTKPSGDSGENFQQGNRKDNGSGSMSYAQTVIALHQEDQTLSAGQIQSTVQAKHAEEQLRILFPHLERMCAASAQLGKDVPPCVSPSLQTDFSYHACNAKSPIASLATKPSELFTANESIPEASCAAKTMGTGYQCFNELVSKCQKESNVRTNSVSVPDIHGNAGVIHHINLSYYCHNAYQFMHEAHEKQ